MPTQKIKEIEAAISHLPKKDLSDLAQWFDDFMAEKWDREFGEDVEAGRLDLLAKEAVADYKNRKCKEL